MPVSIFIAWWILTVTNVIEPTVLSAPGATWDAFVQLLLHQDLLGDVGISIQRALEGLALGAGVGLILGVIVGLTAWARSSSTRRSRCCAPCRIRH